MYDAHHRTTPHDYCARRYVSYTCRCVSYTCVLRTYTHANNMMYTYMHWMRMGSEDPSSVVLNYPNLYTQLVSNATSSHMCQLASFLQLLLISITATTTSAITITTINGGRKNQNRLITSREVPRCTNLFLVPTVSTDYLPTFQQFR